ncbi:site-specific integrase [Candidatus Aerophobetes bacterium]|nr:site-specific integrase [Candidatus Aerophobetes bacterium]
MNTENGENQRVEAEAEAFGKWLEQFPIAEKSVKNYIWVVKKLLKECEELSEMSVNKFLKEHPNMLFVSAVRKYLEFKGLKFRIIKPKIKRKIRPKPPSIEEIKGALEKIEDKDLFWVLKIGIATGARIHEILSLRLNDIDFEEGKVIFRKTKTGHEHEVFINKEIMNKLKEYLIEEKGILGAQKCFFTNTKSTDVAYRIYRRKVKEQIRNKDLARRLMQSHNIRRAVINWILKETGNIVYAKEFVGHVSIATTERYLSELTREEIRKTVAEKIGKEVV